MQTALKTRLLGAAVLIALLVIVVPLFFSGKPGGTGSRNISLDIPPTQDKQLETRVLTVGEAPPVVTPGASGTSDHLATVTIPSRVPPEVPPETLSPQTPAATTTPSVARTNPVAATPHPVAPAVKAPATATRTATGRAKPVQPKPAQSKPAHSREASQVAARAHPGRAAVARYQVSLGAYANKTNAERLMASVRKLGYPVTVSVVNLHGKPVARVDAGPFASRAAAESARLKLRAALPQAPATLVSAPTDQHANAPAKALPKTRAGAWAVQVVAVSQRRDATALRDKLRKAGLDSYVDDVRSHGHTLWRVRVGPQAHRDDAEAVQKVVKRKFPRLHSVVVTVP